MPKPSLITPTQARILRATSDARPALSGQKLLTSVRQLYPIERGFDVRSLFREALVTPRGSGKSETWELTPRGIKALVDYDRAHALGLSALRGCLKSPDPIDIVAVHISYTARNILGLDEQTREAVRDATGYRSPIQIARYGVRALCMGH